MRKLPLIFGVASIGATALSVPLTWDACVGEAARRNPTIAAASESLKSAEAQVKASYGNFLPQITGSASALRGNFASTFGGVPSSGSAASIGNASSVRDNISLGVSATEELFSGFRDTGRVDQAKANLEISRAALTSAKAQVSSGLRTAYAELLYAQELIKLSEAIAERSRQNLRLVKLRFEGGRENKGSYLLSVAELTQAEYQIAHAGRDRHVAQRQLAQALGRSALEELEVTGALETYDPPAHPDFQALALQTPSHVQAMQKQVLARADIDVAKATFYPELDLVGSLTAQGQNRFPNSNRWYVGLNLSYPLFNGGQNYFGIESAQASERAAALSVASTDLSLLPQIEQAYASFQDAVEQRAVAEHFFEAATSRATIARGKYATGLMTFEDWDIIENDLINRETAALQAKKSAVVAEASWEQALGKGAIP